MNSLKETIKQLNVETKKDSPKISSEPESQQMSDTARQELILVAPILA